MLSSVVCHGLIWRQIPNLFLFFRHICIFRRKVHSMCWTGKLILFKNPKLFSYHFNNCDWQSHGSKPIHLWLTCYISIKCIFIHFHYQLTKQITTSIQQVLINFWTLNHWMTFISLYASVTIKLLFSLGRFCSHSHPLLHCFQLGMFLLRNNADSWV